MDWSSIWQALTGERFEDLETNAIKSIEPTTQVDFVELFNPRYFKASKGNLDSWTDLDLNHSHVRLEGGNLTKKAASYPLPLVRE